MTAQRNLIGELGNHIHLNKHKKTLKNSLDQA